MIRIAICDDDIQQQIIAENIIKKYLESHSDISAKIHLFSSAIELLNYIDIHDQFDLYILDIIMPEIDGIQLGKTLRDNHDKGQIIYLTNEASYAIDAYDTYALHYLLKPLNDIKFFDILNKAVELIHNNQKKGIHIKTRDDIVRINIDDISFIELTRRCLKFHLNNNNVVGSTTIRVSFAEAISEVLEDERFFLCGASFAVNLHQITSIKQDSIVFNNGLKIYPSKKSILQIKTRWLDYWLDDTKSQ